MSRSQIEPLRRKVRHAHATACVLRRIMEREKQKGGTLSRDAMQEIIIMLRDLETETADGTISPAALEAVKKEKAQ